MLEPPAVLGSEWYTGVDREPMRIILWPITVLLAAWSASGTAAAQGPSGSDADEFVTRMLAFDKNHDGRVTRKEVTDPRLHRLFDRADANHDGLVTELELRNFYRTESSAFVQRHGLHGEPDEVGAPPISTVIPKDVQQHLDLSVAQRDKLAALQSEVDRRLKSMLTEKQQDRLKSFRGPGRASNGFRNETFSQSSRAR